MAYTVVFHDVSAETTTTLLSQSDPSASGGATSDRNLFLNKPGTAYLSPSAFPAGWEACDYITVKFTTIDGAGFGAMSLPISVNYYLRELCETGCEESFSYSTSDNLSVTFTYISAVSGHDTIKFTCPHITNFTPGDGKSYSVNPGMSHGSPTVLTWIGNVTACVPITFDLTFTPDCAQNQSGRVNIWTDFKVNEVSKKNDNTPNIVYHCPQ